MKNEVHKDVQKIGDLLRLAKEQGVSEIEAEIPYFTTSTAHGTVRMKATWKS